MSKIESIKNIVQSWKCSELTSDQAMQEIAKELVVRHKLDGTDKKIKFYSDLLQQANDNYCESVYEFLLAVYEQWGSVSVVARYIKRTRVGTLGLMRNLGIPINLKKGGSNNRRHIG